ncbi:MAG: acyl carrier protein [Verrucomicrobiota bacterium]
MSPESIIIYIEKELLLGLAPEPVTTETEIITTGLLDSIAVMRLVAHLEKQLGRKIPEEHMILENFATVNALTAYLDTLS